MKTLLTLLLSAACITGYASEDGPYIRFRHIDTDDGLSHNGITSMHQDRRGFIWIGTRDGLNLYNGTSIKTYRYDKYDTTGLYDNSILRIEGDGKDAVFIKSSFGITGYDISRGRFHRMVDRTVNAMHFSDSLFYSAGNKVFRYNVLSGHETLIYTHPVKNAVITDIAGTKDSLMIGTDRGLWLYTETGTENLVAGIHVYSIFRDSSGTWWVCSYDGQGLFSIKNGDIRQYRHHAHDPHSLSNDQTHVCCEDNEGNIWVGTFSGLNRLDRKTGKFTSYKASGQNGSLTESSIWTLMRDRQGTLWAGTYYGGVNYFSPSREDFRIYTSGNIETDCLSSPVTGQMTEDRQNRIWICTEGGGLCMLDRNTGKFKWYLHDEKKNSISHNHTKCVSYDARRHCLWIGTHLGGLNRLDLSSGQFTVYRQKDFPALPSDIVMGISHFGNDLILSTLRGVVTFNPETGRINPVFQESDAPPIPDYIYFSITDSDNDLWIICDAGRRLCRYNLISGEFREYPEITRNPDGKFKGKIVSVFEDSEGKIWICTNGNGLELIDDDSIRNIDSRNGLASNVVYAIRETGLDKFILTTDTGISVFDYRNMSFSNYSRSTEIPLSSINENSLYVTHDAEIFVGGMDGMMSFKEEMLGDKSSGDFEIYPYSLTVNGEEIVPCDCHEILDTDISVTDALDLRYRQNSFTLRYTVTDYLPAGKYGLEYRLHGHSDKWLPIGTAGSITYSKLKPGKYLLEVRTTDSTGITPVNSRLHIKVRPPFYASFWACLIYIASAVSAIWAIARSTRRRLRLSEQLNYEKRHAEDIEKMNQEKLQFFTDISHEFRTPASIISGQVKILMEKYVINTQLYSSLNRIYKSATQLNDLIDELLEFRKLDRGYLTVKVSQHDLVKYLHGFYDYYRQYADEAGVRFTFSKSHDRIEAWFDMKQMYKVVNNLLSNAFKYVDKGGTVSLSVRKGNMEAVIEVSNTGSVIEAEDTSRIFDRFYQADNAKKGTGIGLHLAKGIVEKHHGSIEAYSDTAAAETTFCVHLPLDKAVFGANETADTDEIAIPDFTGLHIPDFQEKTEQNEVAKTAASADARTAEEKKYRILTVEDNKGLTEMFQEMFSPFYDVISASDGTEGLETAVAAMPDLVISDVMMPGLSGIELCRRLKDSPATENIPVILLSANTGKEQALAALRAGADDFMGKPFDVNILIAKCNNLLSRRRHVSDIPARKEIRAIASNIREQEFIDKARKAVIGNLGHSEFDVRSLASEVGLSRTVLFTRLKDVTGKTPKEFITDIRLEKVAEMLDERSDLNISDIAGRFGFSSMKNFRKLFREKFGVSPSEYRGLSSTDEGVGKSEEP